MATEHDEAVLGESSVAAPVFDATGLAVGALALVLQSSDWPAPAGLHDDVREAARNVSRELRRARLARVPGRPRFSRQRLADSSQRRLAYRSRPQPSDHANDSAHADRQLGSHHRVTFLGRPACDQAVSRGSAAESHHGSWSEGQGSSRGTTRSCSVAAPGMRSAQVWCRVRVARAPVGNVAVSWSLSAGSPEPTSEMAND